MAARPKLRRWQAVAAASFMAACCAGAVGWLATGCDNGWDPLDPFKRNAPEVDEALQMLDGGQYESAEKVLSEYLGTGPCSEDGLSLPDRVRQRPNGSFDLGLTLFNLAEQYGRRFGEEEADDGEEDAEPVDEEEAAQRSLEIDCALIVVGAIANDPKVDVGLRARAHYLAGNLEFLRKNYEQAVRHYDQALRLIPGVVEEAGGDGIGRDAAHNRAIALRRIEEEQQDAGADGGEDSGEDSSDGSDEPDGSDPNSAGDAGPDGGGEEDGGEDGGGPDGGEEDQGDEGEDAGDQGQPPPDPQGEPSEPEESEEEPEAPAPQPGADQDERLLDEFEEAPTYQEQEARKRARSGSRKMEDK